MSRVKQARPAFHVSLSEVRPDGTRKERFDGTCDAYVLGVAKKHDGEPRVFTDHDGLTRQRRRAIQGPRRTPRPTIGLGR